MPGAGRIEQDAYEICDAFGDRDRAAVRLITRGTHAGEFTANCAAAHGGSVYAACDRPKIRELFRLAGLDCRIPLARPLDEALAAARTTPG